MLLQYFHNLLFDSYLQDHDSTDPPTFKKPKAVLHTGIQEDCNIFFLLLL